MRLSINGQIFEEDHIQKHVDESDIVDSNGDSKVLDELDSKTKVISEANRSNSTTEVSLDISDLTQPTKDFLIRIGFKF